MNRRFNVFVTFVALAVGLVVQAAEAAIGSSDYIQSGLIAQWDGIENAGVGTHDATATTWVDLKGSRDLALGTGETFGENCLKVTTAGSHVTTGWDLTAVTFEFVLKRTSGSTSIRRWDVNPYASTFESWSTDSEGILERIGTTRLLTVKPVNGTVYSLVTRYTKGGVHKFQTTANGVTKAATPASSAQNIPASLKFLSGTANLEVYAIRVYDRELTDDDIQRNNMVDAVRFRGIEPASVVSGTVTVYGKTYVAGESFPYAAEDSVAIDSATDATIALPWHVSTVTLTSGTLALANGDAVLKTIGNLTLGADARLKLTGNGLQVTGTVTADASAAVVGPGVFVAKEDATPVVLEGGATYFSSRGAFAGWPDSGVACLPVGTVAMIATEEDVTKVAGLDGIVFLDDGTDAAQATAITNSASAAWTLSARLQGQGKFNSANAGALTLAGDNSLLTSPGRFRFDNTEAVIAHERGLGAGATATAVFKATSNTKAKMTFNAGVSGVVTNEAAVSVQSTPYVVAVSPNTARLVQHGNFAHPVSGTVKVGGTLEFYGCKVSSSNYLYFDAAVSGQPSHVWFGPECTYGLSYAFFCNGESKIHFSGTSKFNAAPAVNNAFCEGVDVLKDTTIMPWQKFMVLDLQGYDQHLIGFVNDYVGAGNDFTRVIKSATPATLTVTGGGDITHWPKFEGEAGYCHASTKKETIKKYVSSSTNLLDVAKGTVVLADEAGWSGDVTVRTGAVLELSSAKAIQGGNRRLTVEAGGSLVLKAGSQCYVASANIAGTELESGTIYTVAMLRDTMGLPVSGDDLAALTVKDTGVWKGWPSSGTAKVPTDTTVYIGDEDVANVNALDDIVLMPGSSVICTNVENGLTLQAKISGSGSFVAANAAPIVLLGDNSGLQAPGTFSFTNTYVVVSNRYGLGSVGTAIVKFNAGTKKATGLRFGGEGLVCDAPIDFATAESGNKGTIGPDLPGETLIFSNSFRIVGTHPNFYFRNWVRFAGGTFGVYGNNHLYSKVASGKTAEVWFDSGVKVRTYFWFASDIVYHLGWNSVEWVAKFIAYTGGGRAVCESANALKVIGEYGAYENACYVDLNGIDQSLNNFTEEYRGNTTTDAIVVTSAVPAVVRVSRATTDANFLVNGVRFRGEAGYVQGAACTNSFRNFFSDTHGPLTVEKGGLRLQNNAGWGGTNVTVKAGARLILADTAAEQPFVRANTRVETALTVEEGGKIVVDLTEKPVKVRSFTYAGAPLERGIYTKANCAAIEGEGSVNVLGNPGLILIIR